MPSLTVRDVIERIRFNTATQDDLTNKSANTLFSNKNIIQQLKFALDQYSNYTKALDSIYSLPLAGNISVIDAPTNILRSEGVRFLVWFINGYAYPLNEMDLNMTYANFPVTVQGLPKWFQYWDDQITFYPQNSNGPNTTTVSGAVAKTDTTINVASSSGFPDKNGRFSINDEKIKYKRKEATSFIDCTRGIEDTTAAAHSDSDTVSENNVWVYYTRLHFHITVLPDDSISETTMNKSMLVYDEHIEVITDYASYKLLSKIDQARANLYKVNYADWLKEAKKDIVKARSRIQDTGDIRPPYEFENSVPFWRN